MVGRLINLNKKAIPVRIRQRDVRSYGFKRSRRIGESALVDFFIAISKEFDCYDIRIRIGCFVVWIIEPACDLEPDLSEWQHLTRDVAQYLYSASEIGCESIWINGAPNIRPEIVPSAWEAARKIVTELSNLLGVGQFYRQ
jgi:hypothetical protein